MTLRLIRLRWAKLPLMDTWSRVVWTETDLVYSSLSPLFVVPPSWWIIFRRVELLEPSVHRNVPIRVHSQTAGVRMQGLDLISTLISWHLLQTNAFSLIFSSTVGQKCPNDTDLDTSGVISSKHMQQSKALPTQLSALFVCSQSNINRAKYHNFTQF